MNPLFLGLLIGGIVIVVGVAVYNWLQLRRLRRGEMRSAAQSAGDVPTGPSGRERFEPMFNAQDGDHQEPRAAPANAAQSSSLETDPVDDVDLPPLDEETASAPPEPLAVRAARSAQEPDPEIECVVLIDAAAVPAAALALGIGTRLAKPVRWLGRRGEGLAWQNIEAGAGGSWSELAACLLLADRAGAASRENVEDFLNLVAQVSPATIGTAVLPDAGGEAARADALDRICAELDVQVGLTILRGDHGQIAGTRLRGVAEAAGFRLNATGHFDYAQEETGAILYRLQNYRTEPFTVESLRVLSTPGIVLLLDVPRVAEPVKVFDQLRLVVKRMTQTLEGVLVDDNRRPLTDAGLAEIRTQVQATAGALRTSGIEPGSQRALRLFG